MTKSRIQPIIRRATASDARTLAELGAVTFTETFGHLYSRQDLESFLADSHSEVAWMNKFGNPDYAIWVAELEDATPIGFTVVGPCKLPVENLESTAGEIQQLYVLSDYHNLRLGSRLMETGLEWLEANDRNPLYIGVWSENMDAQRFYSRYGFVKFGEYGFPVGDTVDREFILKR